MPQLKILNSKEIKDIHRKLEQGFGFEKKLDYTFFLNNKNRVYILDKDIPRIDTTHLRINSIGLYFAEINKGDIRLSIEGSQLIGNDCTKNIIDLDEKEARDWLKGIDIDKNIKDKGYIIIKKDNDFLGCGKAVENKVLNYVPKNRRIRASD